MIPLQGIIHIAVPSVSGQAVLTMPLFVPVADLLSFSREVAVLTYQTGAGLMEMISPTNGAMMAILLAAGVPLQRWLRFALLGVGVLVLIGIGALTFLLWEPHLEGRNVNATVFAIYFKDPFLAFAYVASIPFFMGLYHGFMVLGYAGRNAEFSPPAVRSVRTIKYCAMALIGFVIIAEIIIFSNESDDRAGGVMIGVFIFFASVVVATATAVLERTLQNAVDLKSESDLTV